MPSVSGDSGSNRVLPSSLWPPDASSIRESIRWHDNQKAEARRKAQSFRGIAEGFTRTTEGHLSEAAIKGYQRQAIDYDLLGDIDEANGRAAREAVRLHYELSRALDDIDASAQQSLSASPSAMHPGIRAIAVGDAEATIAGATEAVTAAYARADTESARSYQALGMHSSGSGDNDSSTKALDNTTRQRGENAGERVPNERETRSHGEYTNPGNKIPSSDAAARSDYSNAQSEGGSPVETGSRPELANPGLPPSSTAATTRATPSSSPLSGSSLGGLPGGGTGLSSGGLGSSGLGSGSSPLSALTSGMGRMPQASGLTPPGSGSGLPASGLGTGVDPASFSRAVSAGSAAAGITSSPVAPAPPLAGPSTAAVTPGVGSSPVSGASAVPAGLAGSGQHVPSSGPAMPAPGMGAPGAGGMLLPSPGLGAPAAAGGGAATVPASMSPAAAPSSAGSGGGGSAVASGPTLVPAGVATPVAVSRGVGKPLSADVLSAAALTWELARAGDLRLYPMDWAVGVFRSPTGTETVVMSGDGWGYVPVGVFLPRSARLLVSDPLADDAFRNVWFGWADPARIMVEYAKLRVEGDWKLVAAATTGSADSLREAGVDHTVVNRREEGRPKGLPADWQAPVLDRQHQHRLELGYPDLFGRLEKLSGVGRRYQERVIYPVSAALMDCLVGVDEIPQVLRSGWHTVSCAGDPSAAEWAEFDSACAEIFLSVGAKRPGGITDTPGHPQEVPVSIHQYYRGQWVLARAMEHFGGWAGTAMPLSDMVYAAMAAERFDVRAVLAEPLRSVEEDCA